MALCHNTFLSLSRILLARRRHVTAQMYTHLLAVTWRTTNTSNTRTQPTPTCQITFKRRHNLIELKTLRFLQSIVLATWLIMPTEFLDPVSSCRCRMPRLRSEQQRCFGSWSGFPGHVTQSETKSPCSQAGTSLAPRRHEAMKCVLLLEQ